MATSDVSSERRLPRPKTDAPASVGRTVARHAVLLAAATITARLSALALTVVLGHALGVERYGIYGFALALSLILAPIADVGMTPYLSARWRATAGARSRA
jgi:hypothetical protein